MGRAAPAENRIVWRSPVAWVVALLIVAQGCGARAEDEAGREGGAPVAQTTIEASPPCTPPDAATADADSDSSSPPAPSTTSTSSAPSTSAGASSSVTATTAGPAASTVADAELAERQRRLDGLGYWLGEIDGQLGSRTSHAVTAFQKAEGLSRTGRLDGATVAQLEVAARPQPRSSAGRVLEIDLQRQILLVVYDGRVEWVLDIATGAASTPTPPGEFAVYREIDGYRHAPLGTLYRPKYFNGGIALHGYTSVPPEPASHGCVRLTYAAMDHLWESNLAPIGSPVWVY